MLSDYVKTRLEHARPALSNAGVSHLAVFGSRARGQEGPDSDLDVLIDISGAAAFSLVDLVGVEAVLTKATGIKVNAVMRRSLDAHFSGRIGQDIVEIF